MSKLRPSLACLFVLLFTASNLLGSAGGLWVCLHNAWDVHVEETGCLEKDACATLGQMACLDGAAVGGVCPVEHTQGCIDVLFDGNTVESTQGASGAHLPKLMVHELPTSHHFDAELIPHMDGLWSIPPERGPPSCAPVVEQIVRSTVIRR